MSDTLTPAYIVGTRLRAARKAQQLTLADVAGHTGLCVPYLSDLERGRCGRSGVGFLTLARIARTVDVSLDSLLEGVQL